MTDVYLFFRRINPSKTKRQSQPKPNHPQPQIHREFYCIIIIIIFKINAKIFFSFSSNFVRHRCTGKCCINHRCVKKLPLDRYARYLQLLFRWQLFVRYTPLIYPAVNVRYQAVNVRYYVSVILPLMSVAAVKMPLRTLGYFLPLKPLFSTKATI